MARRISALGLALVAALGFYAGALARDPAVAERGGRAGVPEAAGTPGVAASRGADDRLCVPPGGPSDARHARPDRPSADPATAARRPRPAAAFLGDSYTSGWRGVGEGSASWPAILGGARHWTIQNLAVAGTGFVNPGWTSPIGSQAGTAIQLQPGIVIVAGGHNDEDLATAPVTAAADSLLDRLSRALPHAVIVVIGPIWPDGNPKATLVRLRDHLRSKAAELGAVFIDPIGSGWFAGSSERFIGPDGTHPTALGYRRIARLVGAALETDPRLSVTLTHDTVDETVADPISAAPATWLIGLPGLAPCAS